MTTSQLTPAGWYPDPFQRFEVRYWDGGRWTEHVGSQGATNVDPAPVVPGPFASAPVAPVAPVQEKIQRQVERAHAAGATAGLGTLFTEPILVVNQKPKLIEVTNQYQVFDQYGNVLGAVNEVGQSKGRKVLRVLTNVDQFLRHRLVIIDAVGNPLLQLERPAKVFKSTIVVTNPQGQEIGRIIQENVFGKIHFAFESGGYRYGSINAENWRAWNFSIRDHADAEIGRITKTWGGLLKAAFTTADNYVVQIHRPLEDPLRSLVIAASLAVDTALKQDDRQTVL